MFRLSKIDSVELFQFGMVPGVNPGPFQIRMVQTIPSWNGPRRSILDHFKFEWLQGVLYGQPNSALRNHCAASIQEGKKQPFSRWGKTNESPIRVTRSVLTCIVRLAVNPSRRT